MKKILIVCLAVLMVLPLVACSSGEKPDLTGHSIAIFIADGFNYEEANSTIRHLTKLGADVLVAGVSLGRKTPHDGGDPIEVATLVQDIDPEVLAGVVVPGGMPEHINALMGNGDVVSLIQVMAESGRLTAAVCAGPAVLGHARVLEGKRVIATPHMFSEAPAWGATWAAGSMVVEEGNIITASGPSDMPTFNDALVSFLVRER